ncbi:MAG: hypothetical protein PHQ86_07730 [Dehalococcoidales bacterium]|nr:hypothetical protein [Dehalococcoidales bacterium]
MTSLMKGILKVILLASLISISIPWNDLSSNVLADEPKPLFINQDREISDLGLEVDRSYDAPYDTPDVIGLNCHYIKQVTDNSWIVARLKIMYVVDESYANTFYDYLVSDMELTSQNLQSLTKDSSYYDVIQADLSTSYKSLLWVPIVNDPWYTGNRLIRQDPHYFITIEAEGRGFANRDELKWIVDRLERHAMEVIQAKKGVFVVFQHFDPITSPEGGTNIGGDLVVTLKDAKNRGISGKEIFFFKKNDHTNEDLAFDGSLKFPETAKLNIDPGSLSRWDLDLSEDYVSDSTDADWSGKLGEAKWNYVENKAIDFGYLLERFKNRAAVKGKIYAVIFDKDPRDLYLPNDLPQIEYLAEVPVEFKGIAAIIKRGVIDTNKSSVITVGKPGNEQAVSNLPYYFLEDTVSFNGNTIPTIKWLNGLQMTIKVREGFNQEDQYQSLDINYKDAGWYQWFDQTFGNWFVECTVSGAPTAIGMWVGGTAGTFIGGPISLGVAGVILVYEGLQATYDPLIVEPHSKILFDIEKEISVYTLEGSVKLYNSSNGNNLTINQNQTATVSSKGEFGDITDFKTGDLNDDMQVIQNEIENQITETNNDDMNSTGGGFNFIIVIIPVAVIAVISIILVILFKNRRSKNL